jgi:hypothetical protein
MDWSVNLNGIGVPFGKAVHRALTACDDPLSVTQNTRRAER